MIQVEISWKASRRRALQKISTCSLTHDVSSLEDDNVFARLRLAFQEISTCSLTRDVSSLEDDNIKCKQKRNANKTNWL
jgi:DNA-binding HxlR family transcriptional regulator